MTKAKLLQSNLDRAFPVYAPHKIHETYCPDVGFMKVADGSWRFVDLDETNHISPIGPNYRIRADLMSDMSRFLSDRGFAAVPSELDAERALNELPRCSMAQGLAARTGLPTPD